MITSPNLLNIFNLIFVFIVTPIGFFFLFIILKYILRDLKTYDDLYQYKIKSYVFTFICVFVYFCIFILLIISLRIIFVNNTLDLKLVIPIINSFLKLSLYIQIYLLIVLILLILFLIRIFLILDSFFMKELIKLHIYFYTLNDVTFYDKLYTFFSNMSSENDIISYYIRKCIFWCDYIWSNILTKKMYEAHFVIFHSKAYKILFNFSPLWIIIYDCYFHNFVLTFIYPYLVFYVPISIIKRISKKTLMMEYIVILLHEIYYKNNEKSTSIYLMHTEYYPLLEEYVRTQFAFNPLLKTINQTQLGYEFDLCFDMYSQSNFILYDPTDNRYVNNLGIKLIKINNEYFQLIYDEDKRDLIVSTEKWILL